MGSLWKQELILLWHGFLIDWYDSTTPKKQDNGKLVVPTLAEFMSWLVAGLPKKPIKKKESK